MLLPSRLAIGHLATAAIFNIGSLEGEVIFSDITRCVSYKDILKFRSVLAWSNIHVLTKASSVLWTNYAVLCSYTRYPL